MSEVQAAYLSCQSEEAPSNTLSRTFLHHLKRMAHTYIFPEFYGRKLEDILGISQRALNWGLQSGINQCSAQADECDLKRDIISRDAFQFPI